MKKQTTDKQTVDRMNFYTTGKLGKTREITPEGFLLCREVAIARTGTQLYGEDEIPIESGPDGIIRIERPESEVFRDETIASFEGKPVTVEHPNDFVTPETWKNLAIGIVQNVRRGEGIDNDLLMADLLITDAGAIDYVNKSLPELSAGYEAEYLQTEPGRGVQQNIVGNHVALVERGRAGPRCSINDKEPDMAKRKTSFWDRIRRAFKDQDNEALEEAIQAADADEEEGKQAAPEPDDQKQTMDDEVSARLDRIEAVLAKLVPVEEKEHGEQFDEEYEEQEETAMVGDAMRDIASRAEILVPGFSMPTTDSVKTLKSVTSLQKRVIAEAMKTADGANVIKPLMAGRKLDKMSADAISTVFIAASESVKAQNNAKGMRSGITTKDFGRQSSIADLNKVNANFWASRQQ